MKSKKVFMEKQCVLFSINKMPLKQSSSLYGVRLLLFISPGPYDFKYEINAGI